MSSVAAPHRSLVEGEFALTARNFRFIAELLYAEAGIVMGEAKVNLVYSRLARRLRQLGLRDFDGYCALLDGAEGAAERRELVAALTTNVTAFFREPHHFQHLQTSILPPLLQAAKRGKRVRLWSAACSSGQEAYSMALCILQLMPDAASHDIRILATDIDPNMVSTGTAGRYPAKLLDKIPSALRTRWFRPIPGEDAMEADPALRRLVSFRELNLLGTWPMRSTFDAIFCRNVVIYFDEPTQAALWARMAQALAPNGVLYVGHSERIADKAATLFVPDGTTTYRLAPPPAARSA